MNELQFLLNLDKMLTKQFEDEDRRWKDYRKRYNSRQTNIQKSFLNSHSEQNNDFTPDASVQVKTPRNESNNHSISKSLGQLWDEYSQFIGAGSDFISNYATMMWANTKKSDKYFHCKANCEAAKRGEFGKITSELFSSLREYTDKNWFGDSEEDCNADREANRLGRCGAIDKSCEDVCSSLRPNGLDSDY